MLGSCRKVQIQFQLNIIFSEQLDYITKFVLSQELFAKGGNAMYIFRSWITTKNGEKIHAKDYGKRAFKIWIGQGSESKKTRQK